MPVIVVGGTVLPPLVYWLGDGDPAFGDVSLSTGPVTYRLHVARPSPTVPTAPDHLLLVQLLSPTRLRLEVFPPTAEPAAFTDQATDYLR